MADLLSVSVHLPSELGANISKNGLDSPRLLRSSSSENDTAAQTFGISCGKKVVDLEFQDLSYRIPGGLARGELLIRIRNEFISRQLAFNIYGRVNHICYS